VFLLVEVALITLLKSAVAAHAAIGTGLTFYDMLARTLDKIAKAVELTYSFIKSVFDSTLGALYRAAREGLSGLD